MPLEQYKSYLDYHTYEEQTPEAVYGRRPASRYHTFKYAFEHFRKNEGKIIVELGTLRSFVHGGLEGCNSSDIKYWSPNNPERWDWGAGFFSRVAAEELSDMNPTIYTIDIVQEHMNRCVTITYAYRHLFKYTVSSSQDFLNHIAPLVDLFYVDTGDMTPIEPTAQVQLEEVKIINDRKLLSEKGLLMIDDVRNMTPLKFGETNTFGKAKYSIPYLLTNNYKLLMDEYQVIFGR